MTESVVFGSHRKLALTSLPGFERVEHAPQVGGELHGVSISNLRVETRSARLMSSGE